MVDRGAELVSNQVKPQVSGLKGQADLYKPYVLSMNTGMKLRKQNMKGNKQMTDLMEYD